MAVQYTTQTKIEYAITKQTLLELVDDDADSTVDALTLADIIADQQAVIDGYIGNRYTVPLTTVPTLIEVIATRLVVYRLYRRFHRKMPEDVTNDYKSAVKTLEDIQRGIVTFPEITQDETGIQYSAGERKFDWRS